LIGLGNRQLQLNAAGIRDERHEAPKIIISQLRGDPCGGALHRPRVARAIPVRKGAGMRLCGAGTNVAKSGLIITPFG
jgi:hypothetical protein